MTVTVTGNMSERRTTAAMVTTASPQLVDIQCSESVCVCLSCVEFSGTVMMSYFFLRDHKHRQSLTYPPKHTDTHKLSNTLTHTHHLRLAAAGELKIKVCSFSLCLLTSQQLFDEGGDRGRLFTALDLSFTPKPTARLTKLAPHSVFSSLKSLNPHGNQMRLPLAALFFCFIANVHSEERTINRVSFD